MGAGPSSRCCWRRRPRRGRLFGVWQQRQGPGVPNPGRPGRGAAQQPGSAELARATAAPAGQGLAKQHARAVPAGTRRDWGQLAVAGAAHRVGSESLSRPAARQQAHCGPGRRLAADLHSQPQAAGGAPRRAVRCQLQAPPARRWHTPQLPCARASAAACVWRRAATSRRSHARTRLQGHASGAAPGHA
jgi:hypothetical protein